MRGPRHARSASESVRKRPPRPLSHVARPRGRVEAARTRRRRRRCRLRFAPPAKVLQEPRRIIQGLAARNSKLDVGEAPREFVAGLGGDDLHELGGGVVDHREGPELARAGLRRGGVEDIVAVHRLADVDRVVATPSVAVTVTDAPPAPSDVTGTVSVAAVFVVETETAPSVGGAASVVAEAVAETPSSEAELTARTRT